LESLSGTRGIVKEKKCEEETITMHINVVSVDFQAKPHLVVIISDQSEFKKIEVERIKKNLHNLLLKSISHELRSPLNGRMANIDLTLSKVQNAELEEFLQNAKRSSRILLFLIQNANSLAQIETKTLKLNEEECNIKEIISDSLDLMQNEAKLRNISLQIDIEKQLPLIFHSDRSAVSQILHILLMNAAKYTFKGFIRITVTTSSKFGKIIFQVSDTGIGIAQEKLPSLFNPFGGSEHANTEQKHGSF
jgi:signal transduction histidine kinase